MRVRSVHYTMLHAGHECAFAGLSCGAARGGRVRDRGQVARGRSRALSDALLRHVFARLRQTLQPAHRTHTRTHNHTQTLLFSTISIDMSLQTPSPFPPPPLISQGLIFAQCPEPSPFVPTHSVSSRLLSSHFLSSRLRNTRFPRSALCTIPLHLHHCSSSPRTRTRTRQYS